ncbi:MAG: ParA family protein [Chloroflexaceae bacterium]|nr:ParA family protein [Chloroflexaceae bacterium]
MACIVSTVNMKGGVGKTTLTVNIAACLAQNYGKRVLVLDLDSQISATLSLMQPHDFAKTRRQQRTLSSLINQVINPNAKKQLAIAEMICPNICNLKNLALLPGDIELYDEYSVSQMLHQEATRQPDASFEAVWNNLERILVKTIIDPVVNNYDYIFLDCAPGYNLLTRSGIAASNYYLLPARPEPLSLVGIQLLERRVKKLKETYQNTHPVQLDLVGIVFTMSGGGLLGRYYKQVMRRIEKDFTPEQRFETAIPMDINVAKAVDMFMPVVLAAPNSSGSKAFMKLTEEFLGKMP